MYEAWFLAALASKNFRDGLGSRGYSLTQRSLPRGTDVEALHDCKDRVARVIGVHRYHPRIHQPELSEHLPFTHGMTRRSRSFRKLVKELESLLILARQSRKALPDT